MSTEAKAIRNNRDMSYHDMFSRLNEDLLITMISVLKLLKAKVYCTNFEDIDSSGNSPVRQIQRILVETGIAQLLIEILFTLFEPFLFIERTSH